MFDRKQRKGVHTMEATASYNKLQRNINYRSDLSQWFCDHLSRAYPKFIENGLAILTIYNISKLIFSLDRIERHCPSCSSTDECTYFSDVLPKLKAIHTCLQEVSENPYEVIFPFLTQKLEILADDVDNKIENYSISTDREIMTLVTSISTKFHK